MPTPPHTDLGYWLAEARARARIALRLKYRAEFDGDARLARCYKSSYRLWKIVEQKIQDYIDEHAVGPELQELDPQPFGNETNAAQWRCIEWYIRAASIKELYPCDDEAMGRVADLWWEAAWHYGWAALQWEQGDKKAAEEAERVAGDLADQAKRGEEANDFEFKLPPSAHPRPEPAEPEEPADPGRLDLPPLPQDHA